MNRDRLLLGILMVAAAAAICIRIDRPYFQSFEGQASLTVLGARSHALRGFSETRGAIYYTPTHIPREELSSYPYRDHPPLTQVIFGLWFMAVGESHVSARLLAMVFTIAVIPLLFRIGRRLFGVEAGRWAAFFFATSHLCVWDGRIPDYPRFVLLAMMLFLDAYTYWGETGSRGAWWVSLACVVAGALSDWMMYPLVACAGVHALVCHRGRGLWRAPVLALVLVASFAAHLMHLRFALGPQKAEYFVALASHRFGEGSRLLALWTGASFAPLYLGVGALGAALAGIARFRHAPRIGRSVLVMLAAYGIGSLLLFVHWVSGKHAFLATWFLLPATFLAAGYGAAQLGKTRLRSAACAVLVLLAVGQSAAVLVYRHRQTTWYRTDQNFIAAVQRAGGARKTVVTSVKGLLPALCLYYTDAELTWGAERSDQIEQARHAGRETLVVWPEPASDEGFWRGWVPEMRAAYGIVEPSEEMRRYLAGFPSRPSGGYRVYVLPPR